MDEEEDEETVVAAVRDRAEARYAELELEVERKAVALTEALGVFERTQPDVREIWRVDRARDLLRTARNRLAEAGVTRARERAREAEAERRRAVSAPPSLQQLVLDHGSYDRIPPEAWGRFEEAMALWKTRVRAGEFHGDLGGMDRPGVAGGAAVRGEVDDAGAAAGRRRVGDPAA